MSDGIVRTHSYTVVRVVHTEDDAGQQLRLVQLRNPWGEGGEWKGAWSDLDRTKWTPAMRAKLRYDPDASGGDGVASDGLFWMPFDEFTRVFSNVGVCRYFKAKDDVGGIWYKYREYSLPVGSFPRMLLNSALPSFCADLTCSWQEDIVRRGSSRFYPTEFDQWLLVPSATADLFVVAHVHAEDLRAEELPDTADVKELASRKFRGPVKGFVRLIAMHAAGARLPDDWPTRKQSEDFRIGEGVGASSAVHIEGRARTPITVAVAYSGINATRWQLTVRIWGGGEALS